MTLTSLTKAHSLSYYESLVTDLSYVSSGLKFKHLNVSLSTYSISRTTVLYKHLCTILNSVYFQHFYNTYIPYLFDYKTGFSSLQNDYK